MRFWDSSAIAPLILEEEDSGKRRVQYEEEPRMTVWYGARLEVESALARTFREGSLSREQLRSARGNLEMLARSWDEVNPTPAVRDRAARLLYIHPLRAADAFQLAAALVYCRERPSGRRFFCGDLRLREAAENEGFWIG